MSGTMSRTVLPERMPDGSAWPRISVISPSFNQGAYLEEAILSVAGQNYPNLEHIVIDGGSTDDSVAILQRHASKLAHWESEPDRGQSHAINKGMARATGDILTWLNSDDRLAPGCLASVALEFQQSKTDIVAGLCTIFDETGTQFQHMPALKSGRLRLPDLLEQDRLWLRGHFFYQPEVMFTRALWERCGGRLDEDLHYVMDYELWCRFAAHGASITVIGRPIAELRLHPQQKTHGVHRPGRVSERLVREFDEVAARYRAQAKLERPRRSTPRTKRPARIVAVNDIGFRYGAGGAHRRLIEACRFAGHHVDVFTLGDLTTVGLAEDRKDFSRLVAAVKRAKPDVILAGNVHAATRSARVLAELSAIAPVAAVLHDLFLLTGRCAHTGTCRKAPIGCDETCPTHMSYPRLKPGRIAEAWREKRAWLTDPDGPLLLANSPWTADAARSCLGTDIDKVKLATIPLAFPVHVFRPRDRKALRSRLGLPHDRVVVAFADATMANPEKGFADILKAVKMANRGDLLALAIGPGERVEVEGLDVAVSGFLDGEDDIAQWLAAADIVVSASKAETFGQTMIEATLCGTPTVAFRLTGLEHSVIDGVSGLLVDPNPEALADGIRRLADDPELRKRLGFFGRLAAEARYSHAAAFHGLRSALVEAGFYDEESFGPAIALDRNYARCWNEEQFCATVPIEARNPDPTGTLYRLAYAAAQRIWPRGIPPLLRGPARLLRWLS